VPGSISQRLLRPGGAARLQLLYGRDQPGGEAAPRLFLRRRQRGGGGGLVSPTRGVALHPRRHPWVCCCVMVMVMVGGVVLGGHCGEVEMGCAGGNPADAKPPRQ
jgi:hypothetical protein